MKRRARAGLALATAALLSACATPTTVNFIGIAKERLLDVCGDCAAQICPRQSIAASADELVCGPIARPGASGQQKIVLRLATAEEDGAVALTIEAPIAPADGDEFKVTADSRALEEHLAAAITLAVLAVEPGVRVKE